MTLGDIQKNMKYHFPLWLLYLISSVFRKCAAMDDKISSQAINWANNDQYIEHHMAITVTS